jgi:N-carbamoylputrescine amidase
VRIPLPGQSARTDNRHIGRQSTAPAGDNMSDGTDKSRRNFLRAAAATAGGASMGWLPPTSTSADDAPASNGAPAVAESPADVPVIREVCEQHYELLRRRAALAHESLAGRLAQFTARPVTVAAWQMRNHCNGEAGKRANLARMIESIACAVAAGAQVIAFPEMCLPGYFTGVSGTPAEATAANRALADRVGESEHLAELAAAARAHQAVTAFGFCEHDGDSYFDSIGVIDADGTWLGTRRKNPLSPGPYDLESFAEPAPEERTAVFRTKHAILGVANCFDGEFPESVRRMRLAGAELLLWCNAGTGNVQLGSSNRLHHSGSYAQANLMWVVCCNAVSADCYGESLILGPSGEPLVVLPTDREALGIVTVDLAQSADWERYRARLDPVWRSEPAVLGEGAS